MTFSPSENQQLGFDTLLQVAEADNRYRTFERETAHLPGTWEDAVTHHCDQIASHHAAMLANDFDAAMQIRKEAHLLAKKLNGGAPGILTGHDAPGCRLDRACAVATGEIALWGQSGEFLLEAAGMEISVEMEGMFGVGASSMLFLGFSVRAVDPAKLFLSETGYRSFLGCSVEPEIGMTTEGFVRRLVEAHVEHDLKGRLLSIKQEYRHDS